MTPTGNEAMEPMLEQHPFLRGLSKEQLSALAQCAALSSYDMDDYVMRAGQPANHCHLIHKGQVAVTVHEPRRGHVVVQTVGEGGVLGWSWLVPPYRWCFDGHALQATETIALDGEKLRAAFDADCCLGYEMLKRFTQVFGERLHAARFQLLDVYKN